MYVLFKLKCLLSPICEPTLFAVNLEPVLQLGFKAKIRVNCEGGDVQFDPFPVSYLSLVIKLTCLSCSFGCISYVLLHAVALLLLFCPFIPTCLKFHLSGPCPVSFSLDLANLNLNPGSTHYQLCDSEQINSLLDCSTCKMKMMSSTSRTWCPA